MYSFSQLSAGPLFHSLSVSLYRKQLICLTGPNGSGKSTLLGKIEREAHRRGISVGLLAQSCIASANSPGESRRDAIESLMRDGPQLLLLDEPTNHLDCHTFERLLSGLMKYPGALLVVSHDRRILNRADRILHLEAGRLEEYGGGWALYQEQRSAEDLARKREAAALEREASRAQAELRQSLERQAKRSRRAEIWNRTQRNPKVLVNRNRNRADLTKSRLEQNHKRLLIRAEDASALAKEKRLGEGRAFDLRPHGVNGHGTMVTIQGLQLQRGGRSLLSRPVSFSIRSDSRIGLVGPCGIGKSTLMEAILTGDHIERGEVQGRLQRPFLLDQQLSLLHPPGCSAGDWYRTRVAGVALSTRLASVGLSFEMQKRPIASLSGGERMRLVLAAVFEQGCDSLLLDEPTNDLDDRARRELESALSAFKGALLVASHDEEFLQEIGLTETVLLA